MCQNTSRILRRTSPELTQVEAGGDEVDGPEQEVAS
jgi:hypothetical protein